MYILKVSLAAFVTLIMFASDAIAHDLFHPNIGFFGNYSTPEGGFGGDSDGSEALGAKIGVFALIAGVDLGYAKSKFDLNVNDKPKEVDHVDLSIYATHPDVADYTLQHFKTAPYVCLGTGYYEPDGGKGKIGANVGLKVISFIYEPDTSGNGFPVSLDFGGMYHYFPMNGKSITFTEIRAGITMYIE